MENNLSQETLYSLLELLHLKKEVDGSYSRKYEKNTSILDSVALKLRDVYNNSDEEEKVIIYVLLNFRLKQLYCNLKEYEKALNFNKHFSERFITHLESNKIDDYEIPNLIYEAFAQLKKNNHIEKNLFDILDKLFFSDEIISRIVFEMPLESFKFNDITVFIDLFPEEFFVVYIYYVREVQKENNVLKLENSLCFLFEKILNWVSGFGIDTLEKMHQDFNELVSEVGYPADENRKYFICFAQHYLNIEILKSKYSDKYDEEEGVFINLNKNELKTLIEKLKEFVCHILTMKKEFIDVNSYYYTRVNDLVKDFSCYHNGKNIFISSFIDQINNYLPVNEVLDWVISENIEELFSAKNYGLIVDYYNRNKDNDYNLFEIAYSLYEQKCFDESKKVYESIIDDEDGTGTVYNNLSLIYEEQGDFNKAQELLNIALEVDNDDKIAKNNLYRINDKINKQSQIQQIKSTYSKSTSSVEFEILPFRTKVYLGALCRELLSENLYEIKPNIEAQNSIAPTEKLLKIVYNDLRCNQAISVSPRSPVEAFSQEDDFPNTYYTYKVIYNLNLSLPPNKQELIDKILNPKYYSDEFSETAYELWKEIAVEECIEYLLYQLNSVGFQSFKPGDKTNIVLNTLLETFSVGQVYGIVYKSVANASKFYLEKGMTKAQAANSVIGGCQRLGENALIKNWDMSQYSRIKELPQSVLSEFFFNKVLRIGNDGFAKPPIRIELLKNNVQ